MASAWKPVLAILLLCIASVPMPISAEQSGSIQAGASNVALQPQNPQAGDSVTIYLQMFNSGNYATDVEYAFYRDFRGPNQLLKEATVDIDTNTSEEVSVVWPGVTEGEHEIHITFEHPRGSGDIAHFWVDFNVAGLPNLKVTQTELTPSTGILSGDTVMLSSLVRNVGTQPAASSTLHIDLPDGSDLDVTTPSVAAGETEWVNTTFTAPDSGSYTIMVTPDYQNEVVESSEFDKIVEVPLNVDTRLDVFHIGELNVAVDDEALEGPWVVTGKLGITNGSGVTEVPLWLQIISSTGEKVTTAPFTVTLSGIGYAEVTWTRSLTASDLGSLPAGIHTLEAKIDPFETANFIQETTDNDIVSSPISKYDVPDVSVDSMASKSSPSVNSGDSVVWGVTLRNNGELRVSGRFNYTWEGMRDTSQIIYLQPGEEYLWTTELTTVIGSHNATFEATWRPSTNSWDSNSLNNVASGVVKVSAELRLSWALSTLDVTDSSNSQFTLPMTEGENYSLSIDLTSTETGSLTYDCKDGDDNTLSTLDAVVTNLGDKVTLVCEFTAVAPSTVVKLDPSDDDVSGTFTRTFATVMSDEDIEDLNSNSEWGTFTLIGFVAVILIVILAFSIYLTREKDEDVERDIFEYCPACDGELEGDEDRCPHCSFNLKKARKQFHDCKECGESIPDLLDNCVYCGAEQDVSSFFEKRERKERSVKETVALPEETNEDEIVTGTEDFARAVKEFGYDEDQLEEEWDQNIVTAEAEVEAAYDRRNAEELLQEDMTEEELEAYQNTVTTTLKSMKELEAQGNDIDSILASKGKIIAHKDDGKDLSASDADIRGRLYEITGEDGIMPGDKVHVGMQLTDSAFAGNEVAETTSDFTVIDENPVSKTDELTPKSAKPNRRRGTRRKPAEKKSESDVAECGACGADLPVEATECSTCGAKFE